jgi:hypothetical protein
MPRVVAYMDDLFFQMKLAETARLTAERHYAAETPWYRLLYGLGIPTIALALAGGLIGIAQVLRELEARLARTLDLSPAAVELAFHACWIRHAVTEQRASEDPAPRPFLEILRSVANAVR